MAVTVGDICKIILAVLLPPLGVFAEKERCDKDVLINILLTVLGYIPGRAASKLYWSHNCCVTAGDSFTRFLLDGSLWCLTF